VPVAPFARRNWSANELGGRRWPVGAKAEAMTDVVVDGSGDDLDGRGAVTSVNAGQRAI
jgi:hypothetical protein